MKLERAMKQMRDAIGSLAQFTQAAGSKGVVAMELAARDFSYSLARIYAGSGKDGNDGFQAREGLGISPGRAWFHTFRVKGGVLKKAGFFWTEGSSARPALLGSSHHPLFTSPCCFGRSLGIPMSPTLPQELS